MIRWSVFHTSWAEAVDVAGVEVSLCVTILVLCQLLFNSLLLLKYNVLQYFVHFRHVDVQHYFLQVSILISPKFHSKTERHLQMLYV